MGKLKLKAHRRISNETLRSAIESRGLLMKDSKDWCDMHYTKLSAIVNFRRNPTEEERIKLAIALEVPIDDVFPEKYDELYDRIASAPKTAEAEVETLSLESADVPTLVAPDETSKAAKRSRLKENIEPLLENLTPRERKLLEMRYGMASGKTHTLEEVGKEFGVNRERIRQIEAKALGKMRRGEGVERILDYL